MLKTLIPQDKVVHIDALPLYKKYADIFSMDDVPERRHPRPACASLIDQDPSHHRRGGAKEVHAIFPPDLTLIDQPYVGLVYEGRWLEHIARPLAPQSRDFRGPAVRVRHGCLSLTGPQRLSPWRR